MPVLRVPRRKPDEVMAGGHGRRPSRLATNAVCSPSSQFIENYLELDNLIWRARKQTFLGRKTVSADFPVTEAEIRIAMANRRRRSSSSTSVRPRSTRGFCAHFRMAGHLEQSPQAVRGGCTAGGIRVHRGSRQTPAGRGFTARRCHVGQGAAALAALRTKCSFSTAPPSTWSSQGSSAIHCSRRVNATFHGIRPSLSG